MKWIAVILQSIAATFFIGAGAAGTTGFLVPAIGLGIAGLWVWDRGCRPEPRESSDVEARLQRAEYGLASLQSALQAPQTPALEARLQRTEHALGTVRSELELLREDREFFRRLYSESRERSVSG